MYFVSSPAGLFTVKSSALHGAPMFVLSARPSISLILVEIAAPGRRGRQRQHGKPERVGHEMDNPRFRLQLAAHAERRAAVRASTAWSSNTRFQSTTFTNPVSSSRVMKVVPEAVAGRCRQITMPA